MNPSRLPPEGEQIRNITGRCESRLLWQTIEDLAENFEQPTVSVILHYSGYGFDRNGAPAWLVDALRARPAKLVPRIVTYFHELYSGGRPWQRAYWYSSRQQGVATAIARLSDELLTNREGSAAGWKLCTGQPPGSVKSLSVPSNVGEPDDVPEYESRPRRAVTFGGEQEQAVRAL